MNNEISTIEKSDTIQKTSRMNGVSTNENAMADSKDVVVTGVSTRGIGWGTTKFLFQRGFACLALCASKAI